jgi:secreted protein with Ig-like and vWFA domain
MSTSQLEDLKTAHANLLAQYDKHLEDVRALQRAVLEDVLPDVLEETVPRADMPLHEEVGLFAREWLQDEGVWNHAICLEETRAQERG